MSSKATLTERYVAETLRHVSPPTRADVGRELSASIADMVDANVAGGMSAADAERAALLDLGEPERLAARYRGRELGLIGPALYPTWRRVLTVVVAVVPLLVVLGVVVAGLADQQSAAEILASGISAAFSSAVQLAFWITLAFAVAERTGAATNMVEAWTPDELPTTSLTARPSRSDLAFTVVGLGVAIGFFPWQQLQPIAGGVPLLDPELWTSWIPFLMAVLSAHLALEVFVYRRGGWSALTAAASALLSVAFATPVIALALGNALLNPAFPAAVDWSASTVDTVNTAIIVSVVIVTVWEVGEVAWKAWQRAGRATSATKPI